MIGMLFSMPQKWAFERECDEKLFKAITYSPNGNKELAKEALEEGANVNCATSGKFIIFNKTVVPLWEALKNRRTFFVKFLLENGANPNYTDWKGISLLMYCAGAELPGITECSAISEDYCELLIKYGANVNQKSITGLTALDYALRDYSIDEIIEVLLNNGAKITEKTINIIKYKLKTDSKRNYEKYKRILKIAKDSGLKTELNPALEAVMLEDFETANKLIIENNFSTEELKNLGVYSILGNSLDTLKLLVDKGLDVKDDMYNNCTALTLASKLGNMEIVKYLIEEKNVSPEGREIEDSNYELAYALPNAILNNHFEIAKYLISKGSRMYVVQSGLIKRNGLLYALKSGNKDMVQLMLDNNYPTEKYKYALRHFDEPTSEQLDALEYFIEKTNYDSKLAYTQILTTIYFGGEKRKDRLYVAKWLVERGANVNGGEDYLSPLEGCCCENGEIEVARYLISQGADVNSRNGGSLNGAIKGGYFDIVKLLVENGAKIDERIIERAEEVGSNRILKYLKSHITK